MKNFFYFCAASLVALTGSAHAALRSPQVPVAANLGNFFAYYGQHINVVGDQLDLQFVSLDAGTSVKFLVPMGTVGTVTLGGYNARRPVPHLYQLVPEFTPMNWFATASFDKAPTRLVVSMFDRASVLQGTNIYHGADRTAFGLYATSDSGVVYSQDALNDRGKPRVLAYAATGALAGSIWFACDQGGVFGYLMVLVTFSTPPVGVVQTLPTDLVQTQPVDLAQAPPVGVERTSWGRLKRLYR